jgi:hypothetical protein
VRPFGPSERMLFEILSEPWNDPLKGFVIISTSFLNFVTMAAPRFRAAGPGRAARRSQA